MSFHFKQVFSANFKEKLDLSQKKSIQPVLQRFELRPVFEFVEKTSIEKSKMFVPQRNSEGKSGCVEFDFYSHNYAPTHENSRVYPLRFSIISGN